MLLYVVSVTLKGQDYFGFRFTTDINSYEIKYESINDLIIIHLALNDSSDLNFILDSGSKHTILFYDDTLHCPLKMLNNKPFEIAGWGQMEPHKGIATFGNTIQIGDVKGEQLQVIGIAKSQMDVSPYFGKKIDGILGSEIFKYFKVELNNQKGKVVLYRNSFFPDNYRKAPSIPLIIDGEKPYIKGVVHFEDGTQDSVTLLIDIGDTKALNLIIGSSEQIKTPQNFIYANLGVGLNGLITGYLGKSDKFVLGNTTVKGILTAYPDELSLEQFVIRPDRNGSIGMGYFSKFNCLIDVANQLIYLKKNSHFKDPFLYNRTGIELRAEGENFRTYFVGGVVPYTPAYIYGLRVGDQILEIDGHRAADFSYEQINSILESHEKNFVALKIKRGNTEKYVILNLFSLFKDE
ncbi:MAG: PDZ domain-containing protein [Chitinophagales bacterium]|nr:PDZ domain-containing protein [Chitinophagales bacterium]